LKLIDSSGVAHNPALLCAGCPAIIGHSGTIDLVPGGTVKGAVYFKVPDDVTFT
jgi:hypothetical protein